MIALMMGITIASVIIRYVFKKPIMGAYEITEVMMVVVVFGALAYAQLKKRHVNVDFVVGHFSTKIQAIVDSIVYLLAVVFFAIFTWRVFAYTEYLLERGESSVNLRIPYAPFTIIIAVGGGLLCLVLLVDLIRTIMTAVRK